MSKLINTLPEITQALTARSNGDSEPSAMGALSLFRLPPRAPLCSKLANFSGQHLLTG